ncbi:PLP-dependent aspartate aminotransferase family protein [uncultured Clostridium sp.]|uniref:trans-sulfuration enzyme family protein n=1 Tax=uncultured Clostridium sp. TaxID=59620 RepID=UPI00261805CC|nr:PLP-dependent aspartate aminotransferase family protein [uncultured Clostridium sp.]
MRKDSLLIHGGISFDKNTGAVNVPIYQTSTYKQYGIGERGDYEYSRSGNPTREALEKLIADLEEGEKGFAFASGLAAITAVLSMFRSGDKILINNNLYGGTFRLLDKIFSRFNIEYEIFDDYREIEEKIDSRVKAVYVETPTNPLLDIVDIKKVSEVTKRKGIYLIVDNTFMSPYFQNSIKLGADIVVHSATKYLGGHSDLVAGLVVTKGEKIAEEIGFIQNSTGGILQPFDSFLLIRGIRTLGLRMERHEKNAQFIAEKLDENSFVEKVYYVGLENHVGYEIQKGQASGFGSIISFKLTADIDYRKFIKNLKLITFGESLGGVESLLCHPASMTHAAIPKKLRERSGITESLLRLSVGIEDKNDLLEDILKAIEEAKI